LPSVGAFGDRLPGGNDDKKCKDKIIEMFFRKSHAPNHCCHVAAADVTTVSPQLRKCIVEPTPTVKATDFIKHYLSFSFKTLSYEKKMSTVK